MAQQSIEENIQALESLVSRMEQEDLPLEEALKEFKKGIKLVTTSNKQLDLVEKQLKILMEGKEANGSED